MSLNDDMITYLRSFKTPPTATHSADNAVTNASEVILAANTSRRGMIIQNTDSADAARINLTGAAATITNGLQLKAGESISFFLPNCPTGDITAIREGAADTTIHVVEFT